MLIALSALLFSTMAVLARTLTGVLPAAQISAYRFTIGLLGTAVLLLAQRKRPVFRKPWLLLLRGGLGGTAAFLYFYAIEKAGVGPATMLNYISPVYAAVFAVVFLKERSVPLHWLGLVFATAGGLMVTAAQTTFDSPFYLSHAAWAGLASGILGGAAMTTVKALRDEDTDPSEIFIAFCGVGLAVVLLTPGPAWKSVRWDIAPTLAGIGILSMGAQLLFTYALRFTSTAVGTATTQLVPVLVWVLAVAFLHETFTVFTAAGATLCIAGVLLAALSSARR